MRPIILKGHERSITCIKYNREGDLIFSCAKDNHPSVWYSHNGERIGTYEGHTGAVWVCDVSADSSRLITGGADTTAKLFDVATGELLFSFPHSGPVRSVQFSTGCKYVLTVTDPFMQKPATVSVYEISPDSNDQSDIPILTITEHGHKGRITGACWMPLNEGILTTGADGVVKLFDAKTGEFQLEKKVHTADITGLSMNKEQTLAITSSKDNTASLLDLNDKLNILKTYETDRPVNSASISPIRNHVVLGGGQEAMSVTTTAGQSGKFEAHFFHMIYEKQFGKVKGHFGPINSISFHPDGKSYASGAEDGYIRINFFDPEYFDQE